jgi:hypothetical protein
MVEDKVWNTKLTPQAFLERSARAFGDREAVVHVATGSGLDMRHEPAGREAFSRADLPRRIQGESQVLSADVRRQKVEEDG